MSKIKEYLIKLNEQTTTDAVIYETLDGYYEICDVS
jgi:hypothetical protein